MNDSISNARWYLSDGSEIPLHIEGLDFTLDPEPEELMIPVELPSVTISFSMRRSDFIALFFPHSIWTYVKRWLHGYFSEN